MRRICPCVQGPPKASVNISSSSEKSNFLFTFLLSISLYLSIFFSLSLIFFMKRCYKTLLSISLVIDIERKMFAHRAKKIHRMSSPITLLCSRGPWFCSHYCKKKLYIANGCGQNRSPLSKSQWNCNYSIVKTLLGSTIPGTQLTLNTGAASKFVKDIVGVLTWVPILASKSKNGPRSGTKKALPGSTIQG